MHLIVTDKGQVVGTLRVVNSTDYAKIGRVAVKADFRGKAKEKRNLLCNRFRKYSSDQAYKKV